MRNILTAVMIPAVCLTLAADSSGRLAGTVTGKDGKPIPNATVKITRYDITWSKDLKVSDKGMFMQVGIEPKEFELVVEAPGYQGSKEKIKIPLGDTLKKDIVLLTLKEAQEEMLKNGTAPAAPSAGEAQANAGSTAFNQGLEFYNQQQFPQALPFFEKSVNDLHEAFKTLPEGDGKTALAGRIATIERVYGLTLFEVGKGDPDKKDLLPKAEPYLAAAYEKNPKDQRSLTALVEVAKAKGDAAAEKKYQDALDTLIGPRPELAYNDGVAAFNAGNYKVAKVSVTKAISVDPKFPDSYWLLGVVEFSLNNTAAAKVAFKHYLELAPNGKKAGEVKEFLKELK